MYHVTRNKKPKSLIHDSCFMIHDQKGATLLISILVMSGLALTSLAVASFAIQELRSSRAVAVSEPAIAAAETAGEQGLWAIKRSTAITTCPTQTTVSLGNGAFVNSCKSYGSATFNLQANVALVLYLYDPNNINGDLDLKAMTPSWYNTMTVTHKSGAFSASATITRLDGTPVASASINPGATQNLNGLSGPANADNRMKVVLLSSGNATLDVNTDQGMPKFPIISAGGCAAKGTVANCNTGQELFNRRINIIVPE